MLKSPVKIKWLKSVEITDNNSENSSIIKKRILGTPFKIKLRYSKDVKSPNDISLHGNVSLNKATSPPPFLPFRHLFMKLKFGGAVSLRTVALVLSVNHVSVRKRKFKLCEIMKSLTNSDLLDRDLIVSRASVVKFTLISVVF